MATKTKERDDGNGRQLTLRVARKALSDLRHHPRNPRIHPEAGTAEWEALKRSLEHDYFDPIVWNERNGFLVSGHLRHKVLTAEGYTHADVVIVDYDDPTHVAKMIAANRHQGEDDQDVLNSLFAELKAGMDGGLQLTGFTEDEITDLFKGTESRPNSYNPGAFTISYQIVFEDVTQQNAWFELVRWVRARYPQAQTIAAALALFVKQDMERVEPPKTAPGA